MEWRPQDDRAARFAYLAYFSQFSLFTRFTQLTQLSLLARFSQLSFFSYVRRLCVSAGHQGIGYELDSGVSAQLRLSAKFYSKEAVLRASYWFTDRAYIHVPESSADELIVCIKLKTTSPTLDNPKRLSIEDLVGDFCNSVLDFELRRQVDAETTSLRQLILAKAFSESGVLEEEPPGSVADPVAKSTPSSLVNIVNRD
jgi:His-Xaa-Ser system protein HxsD